MWIHWKSQENEHVVYPMAVYNIKWCALVLLDMGSLPAQPMAVLQWGWCQGGHAHPGWEGCTAGVSSVILPHSLPQELLWEAEAVSCVSLGRNVSRTWAGFLQGV